MAYDAARQRIVLFGGKQGSTTFGDVWEWDGTNWGLVTTTAGPAARSRHAMVYDPARQRVVLFGGLGTSAFADTWEWDGTYWTPRLSANYPPARGGHAMAYDQARQYVVLFGGSPSPTFWPWSGLADTWEWDGINWSLRSTLPGFLDSRVKHAMTWLPSIQRTVRFSGMTALAAPWQDTLAWDGTNWSSLSLAASPAARYGHAMAHEETTGRVVLFGGYSSALGYAGDTWTLGSTVATATAYGAGCGSPPLALDQVAGARPILGQTARAIVPNAPTPVGALAVGLSNQTAGPFTMPLPLSGFGMTGCLLWQSAEFLGLPLANTPGGLEFALPLPLTLTLLGGHIFLQAYALAPGQNPAAIIVSNGLDWRFGDA